MLPTAAVTDVEPTIEVGAQPGSLYTFERVPGATLLAQERELAKNEAELYDRTFDEQRFAGRLLPDGTDLLPRVALRAKLRVTNTSTISTELIHFEISMVEYDHYMYRISEPIEPLPITLAAGASEVVTLLCGVSLRRSREQPTNGAIGDFGRVSLQPAELKATAIAQSLNGRKAETEFRFRVHHAPLIDLLMEYWATQGPDGAEASELLKNVRAAAT